MILEKRHRYSGAKSKHLGFYFPTLASILSLQMRGLQTLGFIEISPVLKMKISA